MQANSTTTGKTAQTNFALRQAMQLTDFVAPKDKTRAILNQIRLLAASQDGTLDTAQESLWTIDDLAAEALA